MPRSVPRRGAKQDHDDEPSVLHIPEAAALLRTSTDTIRRAIESGDLEAKKLRGRWLIPRRAVDAYIGNGETPKPTKRTSSKPAPTKRATKTTKTTKRSR